MNRTLPAASAFSLALALILAPAALAQTSDTATVDATATLVRPAASLSVIGAQALQFGTLNIPTGTQSGNSCVYSLKPATSGNPSVTVAEANGETTVDNSVPTPSLCEASGEARAAEFAVSCTPATPVFASIDAVAAGVEGVSFTTDPTLYAFDAAGTSFRGPIGGSPITCVDDGDGGGGLVVRAGAAVQLGETAVPSGGEITVGQLRLTANY